MLRVAVPNKGSLAEASIAILIEAGYKQRSDSRDLVLVDGENNVEFYYLRPRDIAIYVGSGELERQHFALPPRRPRNTRSKRFQENGLQLPTLD